MTHANIWATFNSNFWLKIYHSSDFDSSPDMMYIQDQHHTNIRGYIYDVKNTWIFQKSKEHGQFVSDIWCQLHVFALSYHWFDWQTAQVIT